LDSNAKGIKHFVNDVKKFYPLLLNLTGKDFKLKYRRSFLGILWSILNPLFTMLVITSVFGILLKISVENFATYYMVGWSIWNFFSEATSLSMPSIIIGSSLIKKVYIPKYIFPVEKCLFALVNFLFSLIAVVAVMLIQRVYPTWTLALAPVPIILCLIFSVGMSLILSALTVYFRDVQHLYGVVLTAWMYVTPIIYPMSMLEGSKIEMLVKCNPMYYFVTYFRNVVMDGVIPDMSFNLICIAVSFGTLILGSLIFAKAQKKFILHI
jgi:ABC-2 type transport system permease protein